LGSLVYDGRSAVIEIDDRTLAHLRLVILAKFRRHENFSFSWTGSIQGTGRGTVWMGPGIPIYFSFEGSREPQINRAWIDALMDAANSPAGLSLIPEPGL
jgi:hypothetical protein